MPSHHLESNLIATTTPDKTAKRSEMTIYGVVLSRIGAPQAVSVMFLVTGGGKEQLEAVRFGKGKDLGLKAHQGLVHECRML